MGVLIGVVLCVLNVVVLLRTGSTFGGSALVVVLGAALLRIAGPVAWPALFSVFSVATSGYIATAALDTGVGAAVLAGTGLPGWGALIAIGTAANLLGTGLGAVVARRFADDPDLGFPTLRPATTLMDVLTGRGRSGRGDDEQAPAPRRPVGSLLLASSLAATVVTLIVVLTGHDTSPELITGSHVALAVSPLLLGLGLLIGPTPSLWLVVGAAYSLIAWWIQDAQLPGAASAPYDRHVSWPWILAVGVGVMLGYSVVALARVRGPLVAAVLGPAGPARRRRGLGVLGVLAVLGLGLGGLALATPATARLLAAVLVAALLLVVLVLFLNRAGGEVGIIPLGPALYVAVIVFAVLGLSPSAAILTAAFVCSTAVASVYTTYSAKVSRSAPPDIPAPSRTAIVGTQLVGGLAGAVLGVLALVVLVRTGLIGSASFPAPVSHTVGFVDSAVRGQDGYSGSMLAALGIAVPIGAALTVAGAVPTMAGLGVLLPPAVAVTIALGGLLRWAWLRARPGAAPRVEIVAAGLVLGEGAVTLVDLTTSAVGS